MFKWVANLFAVYCRWFSSRVKPRNLVLTGKKKNILKTSPAFPISKSHHGLLPNPDSPEVFDKVTAGFFWRAQVCLPALSHKEKLSKLWDEANTKRMKAVFSSLDVYTLHLKQLWLFVTPFLRISEVISTNEIVAFSILHFPSSISQK